MAEAPLIISPPKKNLIFDATVLSTLMGCKRLTDLRFNMNLVQLGGKSNSLECGNIAHKYFEVYYKNVVNGFSKPNSHGFAMVAAEMYARGCPGCMHFNPTHDPIYTSTEPPVTSHTCGPTCIVKPPCGHKPNEYPGVQNTPYIKEKEYQVGWKWVLETCEQYYEFYKNDFWVPIQVEYVKGEVIYEDDEIRILWKSKYDLIADTNEAILPVDHKTMKQRRNNISLNNQFMGQCIIQKTRRIIINKVGFQTTLKPHEKFVRAPMSFSAKRLIEWQGTILPYYAYEYLNCVEHDYWAPNFDHCENKYGNCPFIEVCEADPEEREHELRLHFTVGEDWNPTNEEED